MTEAHTVGAINNLSNVTTQWYPAETRTHDVARPPGHRPDTQPSELLLNRLNAVSINTAPGDGVASSCSSINPHQICLNSEALPHLMPASINLRRKLNFAASSRSAGAVSAPPS